MKFSKKYKVSACLVAFTALAISSANPTPPRHAYRVTVRVDTVTLRDAGIIQNMDDSTSYVDSSNSIAGISHQGDLSLLISDTSGNKEIANLPTDSTLPKFTFSGIYETDRDFLNVEVKLRDRDYLWINPMSWGFNNSTKKSDDMTTITTVGIEPQQSQSIDTLAFTSSTITRVATNNSSGIVLNRSEKDGHILETRTLTSVAEYQNLVSTMNSVAYSVEITRLR